MTALDCCSELKCVTDAVLGHSDGQMSVSWMSLSNLEVKTESVIQDDIHQFAP